MFKLGDVVNIKGVKSDPGVVLDECKVDGRVEVQVRWSGAGNGVGWHSGDRLYLVNSGEHIELSHEEAASIVDFIEFLAGGSAGGPAAERLRAFVAPWRKRRQVEDLRAHADSLKQQLASAEAAIRELEAQS